MSNLSIKYIPSAFDSAGSVLECYKYYPKLVEDMVKALDTQEPDINLGVLANAYSEEQDLMEYSRIFKPLGITCYSDSGGLQVITIGKEITPALKLTIYNRQAKFSDLAMSFDEIPKIVLERADTGTSFGMVDVWIDSWFKEKAIESGINIRKQIIEFKKIRKANPDLSHKAKILFIIQAKNFEAAREWSWFMFQEIKKEEGFEDYIGGLALGSTPAAGSRYLTDFIMRFQEELEFLPLAWRKNLHVLGAGSPSRILAALVTPDAYFLPGTTVSADSTTQTRAMVFGNFVALDKKGKLSTHNPGRGLNKKSKDVVNIIYNHVKPFLDARQKDYNFKVKNVDDFRNEYTEYNDELFRLKTQFIEKHGDDENGVYQYKKRARISRFFWGMTMMSHLVKFFESVKKESSAWRHSNSEEEKSHILMGLKYKLGNKLFKPAKILMTVKNHKEYMSNTKIQSGHPYTEVLPQKLIKDLDLTKTLTYNGNEYSVDLYNGELLGRPLESLTAGKNPISPNTIRNQALYYLTGITIDTIKTIDSETNGEIDEW